MSAQRMKIGCAGLGRMGKRHALNFLERTPRAELVAASSPDLTELEWAKEHLVPYGVRLYQNYEDMLKHEGLQAVVVASATAVHAEQAIKAINADKHVLCEKPLSTNVEVVRPCATIEMNRDTRCNLNTSEYLLTPNSPSQSSTQPLKNHT